MFGEFEKHYLPDGSSVGYHDGRHRYYREIKQTSKGFSGSGALPSPSTIAKFADPSADGLMGWAAKRQSANLGAYTLEQLRNLEGADPAQRLGWLGDSDLVNQRLREERLTWRDGRDQKGDVGILAHQAFEDGLAGEVWNPEGVAEDARGYVRAVNAFLADWEPKLLQSEQVVLSRQYGFAGRFDARIEVDGQSWLVDLKTSKFIGRAYHCQLAAYDLAAEECGVGASDQIFVIQVRADGRYLLWPCRATREHFLACLSLYEMGREMDSQLRLDRKEAEQ